MKIFIDNSTQLIRGPYTSDEVAGPNETERELTEADVETINNLRKTAPTIMVAPGGAFQSRPDPIAELRAMFGTLSPAAKARTISLRRDIQDANDLGEAELVPILISQFEPGSDAELTAAKASALALFPSNGS